MWYTKDDNRAPIVDIKVMSGKPLLESQIGDWEYVSVLNGTRPANFNDGLKYSDVYILVLREQDW